VSAQWQGLKGACHVQRDHRSACSLTGCRDVGVPLSLVTKANGFVFVSGIPPFDLESGKFVRGDIEVQTETSLRGPESAGTSLDKVVTVRVYASNAGFYQTINRVYARLFPENSPSRTFVPVASWPMEFDIEIECVAVA
jgi:enamine deaminase RidA (YjgF/YER057c/UK114 family)